MIIAADPITGKLIGNNQLDRKRLDNNQEENENSNHERNDIVPQTTIDDTSFEELWKNVANEADNEIENERLLRELMSMSAPTRPTRPTRPPSVGPPSPTRVPTPTSPTRVPAPTPTRVPSPTPPSPTRVPGPTLPTRFPIPTERPTRSPTRAPSPPTRPPIPTDEPTIEPTAPTTSPAPTTPSAQPSAAPSDMPAKTPRPTRAPTQPTRSPTLAPITQFPTPSTCSDSNRQAFLLETLSQFTPRETLLDMSTPQGMAYFFLLSENNPSYVCSPTVIQRYGLATFYFATDGSDWTNNNRWLTNTQECNWFGVDCGGSSRRNGFATRLMLRTYSNMCFA